ncbi:hydroxysteroid dehydrogenase-like protein 1, partial [Centruroides sculpturatus]|uniref:hydroxysteroid dehydrogenase-like protein 1 n=1 Tax=Centruroides sculpturatus TaxID=218467 RepID=UPI000C6E3EA0
MKLYLLPKFIKQDLKIYGEWAVITGGSSGIGKHTAIELAKTGLKLILISNELEQLQSTTEDIKEEFGVECSYVFADLTGGKEVCDYICSKIEDKDIGIFVNCAGVCGNMPCYFLDETEENTLMLITLNMNIIVNTTYRLINLYSKKKKGVIINVSSSTSAFPVSYMAIYSSCKRFMHLFTKAVNIELTDTVVLLQSLTPCSVNSRNVSNKPYLKQFGIIASCEKFCESWIMSIGKTDSYTGYWLHEIQHYFSEMCPAFLYD